MNNRTKTCSKCGNTLPLSDFYKQSNTKDGFQYCCKSCHNKVTKKNREEFAANNPFLQIILNRWASLNQRCVNGKYTDSYTAQNTPQIQSYQKKGIQLEMTYQEFKNWMLSVEQIHNQIVSKGENSSIDRIDDTKGYSPDNIQLISLHENIEKRYGKKCERVEDKNKTKQKNKNQYIKAVKGV